MDSSNKDQFPNDKLWKARWIEKGTMKNFLIT